MERISIKDGLDHNERLGQILPSKVVAVIRRFIWTVIEDLQEWGASQMEHELHQKDEWEEKCQQVYPLLTPQSSSLTSHSQHWTTGPAHQIKKASVPSLLNLINGTRCFVMTLTHPCTLFPRLWEVKFLPGDTKKMILTIWRSWDHLCCIVQISDTVGSKMDTLVISLFFSFFSFLRINTFFFFFLEGCSFGCF